MSNRRRKIKGKIICRDALTGKAITNNSKDVIYTDNAIDWVKSQGLDVIQLTKFGKMVIPNESAVRV